MIGEEKNEKDDRQEKSADERNAAAYHKKDGNGNADDGRTPAWRAQAVKFLTAQTISLFGSSLVQYAIIWYITLKTSSGVMMSLSTLCGYVPQILISLFAGVWLDRYDRKKLMMLSDAMIALATLAIAVVFLAGNKSVILLFIVLLVRSAGTGIQMPAVNAFIPQIVPQEHLMRINGINSTLSSLTAFLSPAVSALILSLTSIEATFFVDVATAAIGIGIMFTITSPKASWARTAEANSSFLREIGEGFAYLKKNAPVRRQIVFLGVVGFLISPAAFLTPLLVSRSFGPQVYRLALSEMAFSLGAVAGGVLIAAWGGFRERRVTVALATAFYGLMMVGIGLSPVFYIYLVFNCLIGIALPCFNTPFTVYLQENTEHSMHGRVFSVAQIANSCALPLGTVVFGPLADAAPVKPILAGAGLLVILYAIYFLRQKIGVEEIRS